MESWQVGVARPNGVRGDKTTEQGPGVVRGVIDGMRGKFSGIVFSFGVDL